MDRLRHSLFVTLLVLIIMIGCLPLGTAVADTQGPVIDVWYGPIQAFGHLGIPQQWLNILGNVSDADGVKSLTYSIEGFPEQALYMGPDTRRLAFNGDFNVEIDYTDLDAGLHQVVITATDKSDNVSVAEVTVDFENNNVWPGLYTIQWSEVTSIPDAVQIVDGKWLLDPVTGGVRTQEIWYDRVLAVGDRLWEDYEIKIPVTYHWIDPAGYNGPSVSPGFGITMRWTGHTDDPVICSQPHCGWLPSGVNSWCDAGAGAGQLYLYGNAVPGVILELGVRYIWKMRVETLSGLGNFYSVKVWRDSDTEPSGWQATQLVGFGNPDYGSSNGSIVLVAHHVDVTFGDIVIVPILAAPVAVTDVAATAVDTAVVIPVLENDSGPLPLEIESVGAAGNGMTEIVGEEIRYTPMAGFTGSDIFTYTITDGVSTASAPVTVLVGIAGTRVTEDVTVLYAFDEEADAVLHDSSGVGTPLDLTIYDPDNVNWIAGGGLAVNSTAVITSTGAATKVIEACKSSNEITVEAWIKPANLTQSGPARIVANSGGPTIAQNFMLGAGKWGSQPSDVIDARLFGTDVTTPAGSLSTQLTHVVFTRNAAGTFNIFIDNVVNRTGTLSGDFATSWNDSFPLNFANEPTSDRPWLGELHLVAIYNRALSPAEVAQNYIAGPHPTETVVGDFDGDGDVDASDLSIMIMAYGSVIEDLNFDERCDLEENDAVNAADLSIFSGMYGSVPQ